MTEIYLVRVAAPNFVAGADVENGIVEKCAPILRKFRGQPGRNLVYWARDHGFDVGWIKIEV